MSNRSREEKLQVHERLHHLFDLKMRHVPASLFVGGRKPTLQDVIKETELCKFLSGVPRQYDLGWYFKNFNGLARLGFTARKGDDKQQQALNRAIWFLEIDAKHSFGTRLEHARLNMLCMLIVYALPNPERVCDYAETASFRMSFRFAWEEGIKRSSTEQGTLHRGGFIRYWTINDWDLVIWNGGQTRAMMRVSP